MNIYTVCLLFSLSDHPDCPSGIMDYLLACLNYLSYHLESLFDSLDCLPSHLYCLSDYLENLNDFLNCLSNGLGFPDSLPCCLDFV